MLKENLKFEDSDIFEGMPSISAVIKSIELRKSDRKITRILFDKEKIKSKFKELSFLKVKSQQMDFLIEYVSSEMISDTVIGTTHGGIVAECSPRTYSRLTNEKIKPAGVYYLLDGIEDPYNFGNAVRSLYAAGADGLIVGERNWLGVSGVVARSSAGASELIDIFVSDTVSAVEFFKKMDYTVICAGIRDSVSIFETDLSAPILVVLGGEKRGISRAILDRANKIVRIDYGTDFKGSLSASASASVFAFEILRYNLKK